MTMQRPVSTEMHTDTVNFTVLVNTAKTGARIECNEPRDPSFVPCGQWQPIFYGLEDLTSLVSILRKAIAIIRHAQEGES